MLNHPPLAKLLQRAYSGEKAAAFAYIGHAHALKNPDAKAAVQQIERDEWEHRKNVLAIMQQYQITPSKFLEFKLHVIGKIIAASCHVIGWFMPYFFAGKLESGNVCEYFVMIHHFHSLNITQHDPILYDMGMKEKDHELYFLSQIKSARLLPLFEKIFHWGNHTTMNDINLENKYSLDHAHQYCQNYHGNNARSAIKTPS